MEVIKRGYRGIRGAGLQPGVCSPSGLSRNRSGTRDALYRSRPAGEVDLEGGMTWT
jgi:hypothetical protein